MVSFEQARIAEQQRLGRGLTPKEIRQLMMRYNKRVPEQARQVRTPEGKNPAHQHHAL